MTPHHDRIRAFATKPYNDLRQVWRIQKTGIGMIARALTKHQGIAFSERRKGDAHRWLSRD